MADKTIGDLTQAESIGGEDLFVLEQNSEAKKLKGAQLVKYAQDAVGEQVTAATDAAESAETAKTGAESAQTQAQAARDAILNMLVEAITLEQGSPATVEKSIVGSVYKLTFGLPSGKKGDPGATGPANTLTIGTVTSGIEASATITGEAPNQVLNLVLKQGDKGNSGVYVGAGDMPEGYNVQIDPSGSGDEIVTDVTVNGNSIVSDGVGLIKLYPKSLGINTSGIFIRNPNSTDINTRASNAAVSCSQIDYAVKAAMCDGKGEAWTSAEQAAARERIGIPGNYELIRDETINEDIYQYTIDNISLKKAIILFYSVSYTRDNYLLVDLTLDAAVNGSCATVRAINKNGYVSYYYAYCEEGVFHNLTAGPSKPNGATTNSLNKYAEFLFAETITAIKLTAYTSSEVIPAGCRIKVYGVIA